MEQSQKKIKMSPGTVKKLDRVVLRIFLPLIAIAVVCMCLLSPPKLTMGDGYIFTSAGGDGSRGIIYSPGGDVLLGPAVIRLWGAYPIVYGTTDLPESPYFILNLQDHKLQKFAGKDKPEEYKEFEQALVKYGFQLSQTMDWKTLYRDSDAVELRRVLKNQLSCPARRMFTGFSDDKK